MSEPHTVGNANNNLERGTAMICAIFASRSRNDDMSSQDRFPKMQSFWLLRHMARFSEFGSAFGILILTKYPSPQAQPAA